MSGVFITGTDTGVGKTRVACALVRELIRQGTDVGVMKPVETGVPDDALAGADTAGLIAASGVTDPPEAVCPYRFPLPASPLAAARKAGVEVSLPRIIAGFGDLAGRHRFMVVEGAGGWAVPVADGVDVGHIAAALGLPVIVVARRALGTLNHTRLTVDAVRAAGLTVAGVILNGPEDPSDATARHNGPLLSELLGVLVEEGLPWGGSGDGALEGLARGLSAPS